MTDSVCVYIFSPPHPVLSIYFKTEPFMIG